MKITLIVFSLIILFFSVVLVSGPDRYLSSLGDDQAATNDVSINHEHLDSVVHVLSYKEALVQLSTEDSIQLVLDLVDSNAYLFIHGVSVFKTSVSTSEVDKLLKKLPNSMHRSIFKHPLMIKKVFATVIKEPIIEREAPKNPEEALAVAYIPDTLKEESVFVYMKLANGIKISLEQTERSSLTDWFDYWRFQTVVQVTRWSELLENRSYKYQPEIRVQLPKNDLMAVYRALPNNPKVVVYF